MLGRMWSKGNTSSLLIGVQTCTTTFETNLTFFLFLENWEYLYLRTQLYYSWAYIEKMLK